MRIWRVLLGTLVVTLLAATAGAIWVVGTEPGLRWLARQLPAEVRVAGLRGALARDIHADEIALEKDGLRLHARNARLRLELLAFLGGRAGIRTLELAELDISTPAGAPAAARPGLPVGIRIGEAKIARVLIDGMELRDVRLQETSLLPSGVSATAAFTVPAFQASVEVHASGPLERIEASATGSVREVPVRARLLATGLSAIEAMEIDAGPVDLRKLDAAWPQTALDVRVHGTPQAGRLAIANRDPGPLDTQRIPLAALEGAFATDFTTLQLDGLTISLAPAGRLAGTAVLSREEARLDVQASALDLRAFDSRLQRTQLDGPLRIVANRDAQSLAGTLSQPGMQVSADLRRAGNLVEVRSLRAQLERFDPSRFGAFPAGSLSGTITARGALGERAALDARWEIAGRLLDDKLATRGAARLSRDRVAGASVEAQLGSRRLSVRGDFGRARDVLQWEMQARRLRAAGTLAGSLQKHVLSFKLQATDVDANGELAGAWRGQAGWSGEIRALRNAGRYPLRLRAPVPLAAARGKVELGRVDADLGAGHVRIARVHWTPARLASSGEFTRLPAQWLLALAGAAERVKSSLLLDGEWDLSAAPRLSGRASLRRAGGDLTLANGNGRSLSLGLERAGLDARFADGRMQFSGDVAARFAAATLAGEVAPAPGVEGFAFTAASPLSLRADVAFVELRTLAAGLVNDARVDGRLSGEVRVSGTLGDPRLAGTLRGDALGFAVPPYGVYLREGELRARLEGEEMVIERFAIRGGEGRLVAQGSFPLSRDGTARIAWQADRLSLLERPDMRLVATGSGEASLSDRQLALVGALRADRGFLDLEQDRLPKLGDDVVVAGQPRPPARQRARLPLALDLALDLGTELEVRGHGLEGRLAGRLEFQTTASGELRAYGRVQTVNATFLAYGQRLQVDPGIAIFDGPLDNPSLQMTAWRRNQAVEAGVQVSGTARTPRVQLVSQPPVPEGERLSWLVLGRPPGDATRADLGLLQAAAGALLARGTETPIDRRIAQAFGLDELTVRGGGEVASQVVALGKRLSDRLYISFEQGIGAAASALVKLDFNLTQRLSLRAETGTSSGLGLFYRFSWD